VTLRYYRGWLVEVALRHRLFPEPARYIYEWCATDPDGEVHQPPGQNYATERGALMGAYAMVRKWSGEVLK
jgi:hypothetical protein